MALALGLLSGCNNQSKGIQVPSQSQDPQTTLTASGTAFVTNEDEMLNGQVVGASSDSNDVVQFVVDTLPTKGVLVIDSNSGVFQYTPNTNEFGEDSFVFKVSNGEKNSGFATITLSIVSVNDAPTAVTMGLNVGENTPTDGQLNGVDVDGDTLTYSLVAMPARGSISFNENSGLFTYTPNANVGGTDTISYKVSDGVLESQVAEVNVTLNNVNDAPVANALVLNTNEDQAVSGKLTATDLDGDVLSFTIKTGPKNGVLSNLNMATGNFTYTPNGNSNGADSFSFEGRDAMLAGEGNVSISVLLDTSRPNPNPYVVDISVPVYNSGNPEHFVIRQSSDFSHINDAGKRVFFIEPGTYLRSVQRIRLAASGSAGSERYLVWRDPNNPTDNSHPVNMVPAMQAVVDQLEIAGSHWIIDRVVARGINPRGVVVLGGATNVILNRMLIEKNTVASVLLQFTEDARNCALQNSVLRDTKVTIGRDSYAILIGKSKSITMANNEIYDFQGGIQISGNTGVGNMGGHVVYGNELYITPALYTDGAGNYTPTGNCMMSEGHAMVFKGPNLDEASRTIVENNVFYGQKETDSNFATGNGTPITLSSGNVITGYVTIKDNIILGDGSVPNGFCGGNSVNNLIVDGNYFSGFNRGVNYRYGPGATSSITGNIFNGNVDDVVLSARTASTTVSGNSTGTLGTPTVHTISYTEHRHTNPVTVDINFNALNQSIKLVRP